MQELTTIQPLSQRSYITEHGGVLSEAAVWNGLDVFVKTLYLHDPDSQARFLHEGKVAASLKHPLVVPLLAITPTQLIFPFLAGGTLRERLDQGQLDPAQATEVVSGVLNAVSYLHQVGVTHHDVKPENILLASGEPHWDNVRLIDFGMSHSKHLPLDIHSGTRMGTPHFMAPEQFLGVRGDSRSDLYSVGVLLFDCLAGHPPFENPLGWLTETHNGQADLPGPPALHPFIKQSLDRKPENRHGSAAQMEAMLARARQQLGLPNLTEVLP